MVPRMADLPKAVVHHPEAPLGMDLGQLGQLLAYQVIIVLPGPIVVHRLTDPEQAAGPPLG